jgi:hypothetical protein
MECGLKNREGDKMTIDKVNQNIRDGKYFIRGGENSERVHKLHLFQDDLIDALGLAGHPQSDKLFDLAWEHSHSDGLGEVVLFAQELSDLLTG